ncbi:sensor histidine kinase [Spiractinospora alimapuensis]|uniref:sensor histidine kinase n=1 Tax=Spiractinospora alimapuensis TaxID=2820884 RepID=UPI001F309ECB|nr:histidine kinase [Spiractinospora alimapuensis]QVQ50398.1 sensor histidine kinase [Spiractinospora alimapuensis]
MSSTVAPRTGPPNAATSRWPAWARRWWGRRHRVGDWLWAGVVFWFTGLGQLIFAVGLLRGALERVLLNATGVPLDVAIMVALFVVVPAIASVMTLFRRSRPWLLLTTAVLMLLLFGNPFPAAMGIYSYAAWFPRRDRLVAWTSAMVLAWVIAAGGVPSSIPEFLGGIVAVSTLIVLPLCFGLWIGTRRELIRSLHERAERLEREQHLLASSAAAEERTRIAREMHDVVAHRVSLMVLHAGGLEVSASDERTTETAGTIRSAGREALTELRDILGVLRAERAPSETAPQPGLSDLDGLVAGWRSAGMRVELSRRDTKEFSSSLQRTAYRVVQEGLTNCAKHAPSAAVDVALEDGADSLVVSVTNGTSPGSEDLPAPASGYGLGGLGERVNVVGGTLTWGATPGGGWALRAEIPIGSP